MSRVAARRPWRTAPLAVALVVVTLACILPARAQQPEEPRIGQPGKDVIWVPTPPELIEAMFSLADITSRDYVVDLGSGDGRVVIAAARRGARALGVEYDPLLVLRSREAAARAGLSARARFVRGDMYTARVPQATALALFLLPTNLAKLRDGFLSLRPGTRIVINTFGIPGWRHDAEVTLQVCDPWCSAKLWIVPARVEGEWRTPDGVLTLTQQFQDASGVLATSRGYLPLTDGHLAGRTLSFRIGARRFTGTVQGNTITGTTESAGQSTPWLARRTRTVPRSHTTRPTETP